ncbi:MAG: sn-glycerol-3-phosphate ABC transporter ATP-binding protein UgpC [Alicyclobacillaceae bacterium]|nr:sn-glycerol-3-phosphate ABC transporter ATP-binding protein UgpC [Alicyclobacillaceae bacterium]
MAGVTFKHVVKKFGRQTVVQDLNLEVRDGEFLVLVGPSGCGKSTTLRMVAGLEDITAGELYIGDRLVNDVPPKDRDIAMVFQNYALYPHMNVYENMAFGLKLRKVPKPEIDRRVRETAKVLGIDHLLDRKPKALSGGQRQRVALGRAIVRNPLVFLMDEPLSNLDAQLRVQMRTEIARLHRRLKTAVLYVTHDQTEAMTMGDRIAVMKDGALQQVDTPEGIYRRPANLFVAEFFGSPGMNLIPGELSVEEGQTWFTAPGFRVPLPPSSTGASQLLGGDKRAVLGVRPEHLKLGDGAGGSPLCRAVVELVEPTGAETYVYVRCEAVLLTVRTDPSFRVKPGDGVEVRADAREFHLFDPKTGAAVR